jgi:hypothetical protein
MTPSKNENKMWVVVSYGGRNGSGVANEQWYGSQYGLDFAQGTAEREVKRRLGVTRLHQDKRGRHQVYGPEVLPRRYDGYEWVRERGWTFTHVTPCHPDYGSSAGVGLYLMVRGRALKHLEERKP